MLSGGGQNGKHFLFFLFLFSLALFPLTLGLNPELLKKPPRFSRPFSGVVCNNAGSVTVDSLCTHSLSPSLQAQDLPPACFLDSYTITNQHSQGEREEGGNTSSITIESYVLFFLLQRHIDPIPQEHCEGKEKGNVTLFE